MRDKLQQNHSFIHNKCDCCGRNDYVMSEVILKANYGSSYDGEKKKINLCGKCFESVYESIQNKKE